MVQEETEKLSRRARRRAASERESGADAESAADATDEQDGGDDDSQADATAGEGTGASAPQNRKARRGAAARARARRKREQAEAEAIGLDAREMVDDALVRTTDKASRLVRKHWNVIQWVLGVGVIGWLGYQVYGWREAERRASVSDALLAGTMAENGRIGDPSAQGERQNGIVDPTPIFETEEDRQKAALEAYRKAADVASSRLARAYAQLGEAGILLETGKSEEARALYESTQNGPAAKRSPEIRGAALEGLGLSREALKDLPGALTAFQELGNQPGFEQRALLQQARIQAALGKTDEAKELLEALFRELGPPKATNLGGGLPHRPSFLRKRAERLSRELDPLEKDVTIPKAPIGADAVQRMLEQIKEQGLVTPPDPSE